MTDETLDVAVEWWARQLEYPQFQKVGARRRQHEPRALSSIMEPKPSILLITFVTG